MRLILLLLMLLTLGIGLACNNAGKPTIVKTELPKPEPTKVDSHGHADQAPRITVEEAKKEFDAGTAVFVDTRDITSFQMSRIKGAINIPMFSIEQRWKEIPTNKKIIAYCSWTAEHTSASLVTKLKEKGIGNVYALLGGTQAWINAKYPTEGEPLKK